MKDISAKLPVYALEMIAADKISTILSTTRVGLIGSRTK